MDQSSRSAAPPAAAQLQALANTTSDGILTIDSESIIRFANPAVEEIIGYSPEELVGAPLTRIMDEDLADQHYRSFARYLETGEQTIDWSDVQLPGQRKDGGEVPLSISFSEFTVDGERFFTGIIRDLTTRKHREQQLEGLHTFAQSVTAAETKDGVCHLAMATANVILPNLLTTAYLYNEETGRLESASHTPAVPNVGKDTGALFGSAPSLPWTVFQSQERHVCMDTQSDDVVDDGDTPLRSVVAVPFGSYGVLVSGATTTDAFDGEAVRLIDLLASDIETALKRVEREATLRNRAAELEEQKTALEQVNRVNDVIRDLTMTLVQAESREEIEQAVCTKLANTHTYQFAWIGEPTVTGDIITLRASAGIERGYLDAITVTTDESPTGQGPSGRAVATHEVQVQNNLATDPPFEPWRDEALQRGYRACIAVPLVYRDALYGILHLYSPETDVFDDLTVDVLTELGQMIAYAINATERKNAVVSDSTVELQFDIESSNTLPAQLTAETESHFEFQSIVEQTDGSLRVFFEVSGANPDDVIEYHQRGVEVKAINHIAAQEDSHLFEATLGDESFLASLLDYGAHPTKLKATPAGTSLTVELPQSSDIQSFLRMLLETHEGVTLATRRELDRPIRSNTELQALYNERLTEREEEVIRTAYQAGFFESPRQSSGSEVAEMMGVSQPTVNRHLRSAERKLLELVFDEPADGE